MYKRLYEFLVNMDAFNSLHFGFREKHFTNHPCLNHPVLCVFRKLVK